MPRLFNFDFNGPLRDRVEAFAAARSLTLAGALRVLVAKGLDVEEGRPSRAARVPRRKAL